MPTNGISNEIEGAVAKPKPKRRRNKGAQYLIRDIDRELWSAVRRRVKEEGRNIRWVIVQLLQLYANHETDKLL